MEDPEFKADYERARAQIQQVDEVMRTLDQLRVDSNISKAELARRIGKNPASVRRLFTSEANPELATLAAIAAALGAKITVQTIQPAPRRRRSHAARQAVPA